MNNGFTIVGHQTDESCIPLVDNLGESCRPRAHENLTDAIIELLHTLIRNAQKRLGRPLFRLFICQIPNCIFQRKLFSGNGSELGQYSNFKTAHGEKELRVVLGVDTNKCIFPLDCRERTRQPLLDVPVNGSSKINIMLDESHAAIPRPAALIVVANDVVISRIRIGGEIALDEITGFISTEPKQDVESVNVTRVETDGMTCFSSRITILKEVIRHLGRPRHLTCSLKAKNEEIEDQTIILEDEGRELETADKTISIGMCHVLVSQNWNIPS